ncbi:MAG: MaoC family dehydratase [Alphaproteobacteria bacterium]
MRIVETPEALKDLVGQELGVSDWTEVTQARIDKFAESTGDFQWIHIDQAKAAVELPTGTTIAHGFLTLSLVAGLPVFEVAKMTNAINYGCNKVRFTNMVPAGSNVRLRQTLKSAEDVQNNGVRIIAESVIEIEGADRPALVAESIVIYYG